MTWHADDAACRDYSPELWEMGGQTVLSRENKTAIAICNACPVRLRCLDEALRAESGNADRWHIWGGLTPRQRNRVAKVRVA